MNKVAIIAVSLILAMALGLGGCTTPPTPTPTPESTTYTADWAEGQVWAYLDSLAKGPDAIRYLAELTEHGSFTTKFHQSEVGQDVGGHKYSGWTVYYKPVGHPYREHWGNLNWAVYKDGYVTEGSNDALRLKADLIELSQ